MESREIYVGTKEVYPTAMTKEEYCTKRGWEVPQDEDPQKKGYMVEYLKGGEPNTNFSEFYVSWSPKEVFEESYFLKSTTSKSLGNTDVNAAKKNVKDIVFFGNGDTFKLISKASSKNEGWMKSTKAMQVDGVGCVIQITTQQGDNIAEALTTMLGTKIEETKNSKGIVTSRKIVINE